MDKDLHLSKVLESHKMDKIESLVEKHKVKRTEIKKHLKQHYKDKIYNIIDSGSFAKHTAVNTKFDLDIVAPFKRNSFGTLQEMLDDVFDVLKKKYKDIATVKKQTVSVGITFDEDEDGDVVQIDVVPGREFNLDQYSEDNKLNLFINSQDERTYIQTNIQAQIDHIKGKTTERKIIRLLKIWKKYEGYPVKSFFLELATIKAFEENETPNGLWEQLKMTMEYIRDNVTKDNFKLKDPGNSGNRVEETLTSNARTNLSREMKKILKNIEADSDNIKYSFCENPSFKEEGYEEKGQGYSQLSTSNRFG